MNNRKFNKTYWKMELKYKLYKFAYKMRFLYKRYFSTNIPLDDIINIKQPRDLIISRHSFNNTNIINKQYKIAINIHLFYIDLLDEFILYCNSMPYQYDLLISVTNADFVEIINISSNKFLKLNNLIVKQVPNQGRDITSFVVHFASELLYYDIMCHFHSKKSLSTGTEQLNWRQYLLNNLLGSPDIIKNIIFLFNDDLNIGLVYPESSPTLPYWTHTWLQNRVSGFTFLNTLGVGFSNNTYIDYPQGSFFGQRLMRLVSY